MTIRGTTLIGRLAALCTLLFAFTGCGGGGGGFLPAEDGPIDLAITTATLPEATAGTPYTALVEAAGGNPPYSWAITNNNGTDFKIDNDGFITGTAPADGDYGLIITVRDSDASTDQLSTILIVITDPDPLAIATTALSNAIVGIEYVEIVIATGGEKPYTWAVLDDGGSGLIINNDGVISGIVTQGGVYGLSLQVTDDAGAQTTTSFILTVEGPDIPKPLAIITPSPLTGLEKGTAYTAILKAEGGNPDAYDWSMIEQCCELTLSVNGVLSGTPPDEGSYAILVSVTDGNRTVESSLVLEISADPAPLAITSDVLKTGTVGVPYADILQASGGEGTYTWGPVGITKVKGLSLSDLGVLSGKPETLGSFALSYTVTDGEGTQASSVGIISIFAAPAASSD